MFGLGVAKGMLTTLKHILFVKPVTIQYPEQRMEMPTWTRGRPRLIYDLDSGDLRCTACGACAIACPVDVIQIHQHPGPERGKKILDRFDLDMGGCIECALCVEACPFRAIVMAPDFEMATYDRSNSLVFNMHQLRIAGTSEVDAAMEYQQGVKRGLAAQAARGQGPARPTAAAGARPAPAAEGAGARPAGPAARPAAASGVGAARPAGATPARPATVGAGPARGAPSAGAPRPGQQPGAAAPEAGAEPARAPGGGPARPAPQTGPPPMTATRARLLASRGQAPEAAGQEKPAERQEEAPSE